MACTVINIGLSGFVEQWSTGLHDFPENGIPQQRCIIYTGKLGKCKMFLFGVGGDKPRLDNFIHLSAIST